MADPKTEENKLRPSQEAIDNCTKGLVEKFEGPVRGIEESLKVINNRQSQIEDKLTAENEKFDKVAEEYKLDAMIQKTRLYRDKLNSLQKEMVSLSERSVSMKSRAMKLQDAKQAEALRREAKRQQDHEREEALTAKPVFKK